MFPRIELPRDRVSKKPSPYPTLAFHLLRLGQLLSSIIVSSVLIFFIHHLRKENYYIPWTFILLLAVSILTVIALVTTSILHLTLTLNPKYNLLSNLSLLILWVLGLSLLSWNLGWTLGHRCTPVTWHNDSGIMVCRLYKALTAFTVTGLVSTLLALALDLRVHKYSTLLGSYNQMLDIKAPTDLRSSSPFHGGAEGFEPAHRRESSPYHTGGLETTYDQRRDPSPYESEGIETAYSHRRDPSHDAARPYKVQKPIEAQQFGYSAPSEQTSYGGGGGPGWM
ncbi:MAG: hypothetical protein ALECFALPRED_000066 [Alectoria fallacina]|uniref:MARVEL domain-containing protein n=1 Tax=Alectoria fallacina TaxID=1903189 RepID=A0A8H3E9T6_9LECA|nr:MAG: hypothetical protein ALECFALPRED_000066 [Alectoria fallacina]